MNVTSALFIRDPWITKFLQAIKSWEMRGSSTNKRGWIALIKSGVKSGASAIYAIAHLVDCKEIDIKEAPKYFDEHQVPQDVLEKFGYKRLFAWIFDEIVVFNEPIKIERKRGPVVWMNLDAETTALIDQHVALLEQQQEYKVKRIVSRRYNNQTKTYEYEVEWEGYSQTTFEPLEYVYDCAALEEFMKSNKITEGELLKPSEFK